MIEVLKQRLVACKKDERHLNHAETRYWLQQYKLLAEDAIKAIAELESQEPDVVMHWHSHTWTIINPPPKNSSDVNLYYASPQRTEPEPVKKGLFIDLIAQHKGLAEELKAIDAQALQRTWVELTDEEIARACGWSAHGWWTHPMTYEIKIAKAIEAKLKQKNNA